MHTNFMRATETDKTALMRRLICLYWAYMSEGTCFDVAAAQYKANQFLLHFNPGHAE